MFSVSGDSYIYNTLYCLRKWSRVCLYNLFNHWYWTNNINKKNFSIENRELYDKHQFSRVKTELALLVENRVLLVFSGHYHQTGENCVRGPHFLKLKVFCIWLRSHQRTGGANITKNAAKKLSIFQKNPSGIFHQ